MKLCPRCGMRYPGSTSRCALDDTDLSDVQNSKIGALISGRYILSETIGEGGMATVYLAKQKFSERVVAIKLMDASLAFDRVVLERFRREAKNARKLNHPNIVEIYEQGELEDGSAYIVMEHLKGEPLSTIVRKKAMPLERAISIMVQVLRGLSRAHDFDVIHRDIKPENIFLCGENNGKEPLVKLLDFGIARSLGDSRLTSHGEFFGTPQYMAPERISGKESSHSEDIYALGIVFFEILTGRLPFVADDIANCFVKHMSERPPHVRSLMPSIPPLLDELVYEMMAKDPEGRPADMHLILAEVSRIAKGANLDLPAEPNIHTFSLTQTLTQNHYPFWAKEAPLLKKKFSQNVPLESHEREDLVQMLDECGHLEDQVIKTEARLIEAEQTLSQLDVQNYEYKSRFGHAMDTLGLDASNIKRQLRHLETSVIELEKQAHFLCAQYKEQHGVLIEWEGRCAFTTPYKQLVDHYLNVAKLMQSWIDVRHQIAEARAKMAEHMRVLADLVFQIDELKRALIKFGDESDMKRSVIVADVTKQDMQFRDLEDRLRERTEFVMDKFKKLSHVEMPLSGSRKRIEKTS